LTLAGFFYFQEESALKRVYKGGSLGASKRRRLTLITACLAGTAGLALLWVWSGPTGGSASSPSSQAGPTTALRVQPATKIPYRFVVSGDKFHAGSAPGLNVILQVTQPGRVRARILGANGELVRFLADLTDPHGTILVQWDGRLPDGHDAPPGRYTAVIEGPDRTEKINVELLR
jgi:hypothetical protein